MKTKRGNFRFRKKRREDGNQGNGQGRAVLRSAQEVGQASRGPQQSSLPGPRVILQQNPQAHAALQQRPNEGQRHVSMKKHTGTAAANAPAHFFPATGFGPVPSPHLPPPSLSHAGLGERQGTWAEGSVVRSGSGGGVNWKRPHAGEEGLRHAGEHGHSKRRRDVETEGKGEALRFPPEELRRSTTDPSSRSRATGVPSDILVPDSVSVSSTGLTHQRQITAGRMDRPFPVPPLQAPQLFLQPSAAAGGERRDSGRKTERGSRREGKRKWKGAAGPLEEGERDMSGLGGVRGGKEVRKRDLGGGQRGEPDRRKEEGQGDLKRKKTFHAKETFRPEQSRDWLQIPHDGIRNGLVVFIKQEQQQQQQQQGRPKASGEGDGNGGLPAAASSAAASSQQPSVQSLSGVGGGGRGTFFGFIKEDTQMDQAGGERRAGEGGGQNADRESDFYFRSNEYLDKEGPSLKEGDRVSFRASQQVRGGGGGTGKRASGEKGKRAPRRTATSVGIQRYNPVKRDAVEVLNFLSAIPHTEQSEGEQVGGPSNEVNGHAQQMEWVAGSRPFWVLVAEILQQTVLSSAPAPSAQGHAESEKEHEETAVQLFRTAVALLQRFPENGLDQSVPVGWLMKVVCVLSQRHLQGESAGVFWECLVGDLKKDSSGCASGSTAALLQVAGRVCPHLLEMAMPLLRTAVGEGAGASSVALTLLDCMDGLSAALSKGRDGPRHFRRLPEILTPTELEKGLGVGRQRGGRLEALDDQRGDALLLPLPVARREGAYPSGDSYLDTQVRLLRALCFQPLQEAVSDFLSGTQNTGVYSVRLVRLRPKEGSLQLVLKLKDYWGKDINWRREKKRMMPGNLVVVSRDGTFKDWPLLWLTVAERNEAILDAEKLVALEFCQPSDIFQAMRLRGRKMVALESPSFYKAHAPVIRCLQQIPSHKIPFAIEIVNLQRPAEKTETEPKEHLELVAEGAEESAGGSESAGTETEGQEAVGIPASDRLSQNLPVDPQLKEWLDQIEGGEGNVPVKLRKGGRGCMILQTRIVILKLFS
uniref:Uncharacterized protein n=1 Tax=Chromera velia CCMP2878 TaxID=1169474 RepID=A0A0G4F871_9ALVE|eukprot:Cvel_15598.t1-p1 / transcript=Cvel_15598.t1 / gene=Cvel_15598 / organism=Chromera_velia_CCMP2878 / gene_product=hypothetical protein / transcript_product=hypothetical protein / location=Cvel_scaffold1160:32476-36417(+) / protein_length=1039 / sequence_SO=supercontig / SO=protein_coding / is_pseudo=false